MKKRTCALIAGGLLCAAGISAWTYQMMNGMAVTNLRNPFSWGLYIAVFEFFVGAASGGMIVFSAAYLFKAEALRPLTKIAALSSLACTVAAGCIIMPDVGRWWRIGLILLNPNFTSPLLWDIAVMTFFALIALAAFFIQMLPILYRRKSFWARPWLNGTEGQALAFTEIWSRRIAVAGIPLVIVLNLVTALLFATQKAHVWWNTPILPLDSVAVAGFLGPAAVMLACIAATSGQKKHLPAYGLMAKISVGALAVHFVLTAIEVVPLFIRPNAGKTVIAELLFGRYLWLYMIELILPALALILYLSRSGRKNMRVLSLSGLLVLTGALAHRMMLLIPAFNNPPLSLEIEGLDGLWTMPSAVGTYSPEVGAFAVFWNYTPTLTEWLVSLLPFGAVLVILAGVMTIYPELIEKQHKKISTP